MYWLIHAAMNETHSGQIDNEIACSKSLGSLTLCQHHDGHSREIVSCQKTVAVLSIINKSYPEDHES